MDVAKPSESASTLGHPRTRPVFICDYHITVSISAPLSSNTEAYGIHSAKNSFTLWLRPVDEESADLNFACKVSLRRKVRELFSEEFANLVKPPLRAGVVRPLVVAADRLELFE